VLTNDHAAALPPRARVRPTRCTNTRAPCGKFVVHDILKHGDVDPASCDVRHDEDVRLPAPELLHLLRARRLVQRAVDVARQRSRGREQVREVLDVVLRRREDQSLVRRGELPRAPLPCPCAFVQAVAFLRLGIPASLRPGERR